MKSYLLHAWSIVHCKESKCYHFFNMHKIFFSVSINEHWATIEIEKYIYPQMVSRQIWIEFGWDHVLTFLCNLGNLTKSLYLLKFVATHYGLWMCLTKTIVKKPASFNEMTERSVWTASMLGRARRPWLQSWRDSWAGRVLRRAEVWGGPR